MFLAALAGEGWLSWNGFLYGCLGFSGFFIFDICRKLDPYLPKVHITLCNCDVMNIQLCSERCFCLNIATSAYVLVTLKTFI